MAGIIRLFKNQGLALTKSPFSRLRVLYSLKIMHRLCIFYNKTRCTDM